MKVLGVVLSILLVGVLLICTPSASGVQRSKRPNQDGFWFQLAVKENGGKESKNVEGTKTVIQRRCRRLGINCRIEQRPIDPANRLMLCVSTRMDSRRLKQILLAEGVEVRPIVSPPFPESLVEYLTRTEAEAATDAQEETLPFIEEDRETYLITERYLILTGNDLQNCVALASLLDFGKYEVNCRLKAAGAARLRAWTSANIHRHGATVLNREVISAAYIKAPIWYDFAASGFDKKRAQDLVIIFQSGNLPAPVELLNEGTQRRGAAGCQ